MHRASFISLLLLISISSIIASIKFNSSTASNLTTTLSMLTSQEISLPCTYCQTKACRCYSMKNILNCSSYLLNLTFASNCAEMMIWETVDFSSRNLESLDSTRLLSLRMYRLLLKSNLISTINDNTFDSIGDTLIELDLQMNLLSNISSKWLNSKLTQLKILNLALNQLESFIHLDNVQLPYLQELNLSCNQIDIFPEQIHQWTSLIKLDLSFNKLLGIPRFALMGLNSLTWLSLASNRDLTCIIQDSFKYLKSLKYLDLSSTNLFNLDGCIFIPLTSLRTLKIERVSINCSACWLPIAKKNSIHLFGQCINNRTMQRLDSLTDQQFHHTCSKSSIDCSSNYCEPSFEQRSLSSNKLSASDEDPNATKNRTIQIILGVIFSLISLIILISIIIFIYRWKKGQSLFCCDFFQTRTSATTAETTRRRRQQHKQIINNNPTVIESVITHGANMNVPSYSNENSSNHTRKLYNPMFTDSPTSDIRYDHQSVIVSNDSMSHNNHVF